MRGGSLLERLEACAVDVYQAYIRAYASAEEHYYCWRRAIHDKKSLEHQNALSLAYFVAERRLSECRRTLAWLLGALGYMPMPEMNQFPEKPIFFDMDDMQCDA